jgi:hypothetical protein
MPARSAAGRTCRRRMSSGSIGACSARPHLHSILWQPGHPPKASVICHSTFSRWVDYRTRSWTKGTQTEAVGGAELPGGDERPGGDDPPGRDRVLPRRVGFPFFVCCLQQYAKSSSVRLFMFLVGKPSAPARIASLANAESRASTITRRSSYGKCSADDANTHSVSGIGDGQHGR